MIKKRIKGMKGIEYYATIPTYEERIALQNEFDEEYDGKGDHEIKFGFWLQKKFKL